jgi:hypothetical protein
MSLPHAYRSTSLRQSPGHSPLNDAIAKPLQRRHDRRRAALAPARRAVASHRNAASNGSEGFESRPTKRIGGGTVMTRSDSVADVFDDGPRACRGKRSRG